MKRICKFCGKEYNWEEGQLNWTKDGIGKGRNTIRSDLFCCYQCGQKDKWLKVKNTCLNKYGHENVGQFGSIEHKKSMLNKYNVEHPSKSKEICNKRKQTFLKKYGVDNALSLKSIQEKIYNTKLQKYGNGHYLGNRIALNHKEIQLKRNKTCKLHNSFNSSKPEEEIYKLLIEKYPNIIRQYKSDLYPFNCDFYIPELDLYIEINFHWTHGKEPYNDNNQKHKKLIELWKLKNTKFYNIAIKVWTILDVNKRKTAKENNLNWIEFFNMKDFDKWFNTNNI